jgi:hypothetical protein
MTGKCKLGSILALLVSVSGAAAQTKDKPRIYVSGKGTQNESSNSSATYNHWFATAHTESTSDAHDEGMEVTKDLQKECPGTMVTFNQAAADYTVMLNRESKQKRDVFRTNSQVEVVNRAGDVIGSGATRTVNAASKNACALILSDWAQHGRIAGPPAPAAAPEQAENSIQSAAPVALSPALPSGEHVIEGYTISSPADAALGSGDGTSLADAARAARAKKAKQQSADPTN